MKRLAYILLILLVPALAYAYVVGTPSNMVPGNWQAFAVDPGAPDSGVTSTAHVTLKNLVTAIGTTKKSTIVFPHTGSGTTTQYTIGTALDLSSYSNITFQIENGAQLKVSTGVSGVTLPSPANVSAQPNQQIVSGTSLYFYSPGTIYPEWFGAKGDGSTDDALSIQNCFTSTFTPVTDKQYGRPKIYFGATKGYAVNSGVTLHEGVDLIMDSPIVYTGSSEEAALTIGRGTATNYYGNFKLATRRTTQSDWTSENNIGIKIYNSVSCNFDIGYAHFFTIGVQLYADTGGIAGNSFSYGLIIGNKYGLDLVGGPGAGYVNSNTHFGGYFTSATGINTGESRYGIRIRTTGTYKNNNNVFIRPIFELKLTVATPGESVPILIESGSVNTFSECRHEGNSYTFARITAGYGNTFNVPAGTSSPTYASIEDVTVSRSNTITYGGYHHAGSPWHHIWSSGPLHKRLGRYNTTNFHVPGMSIQGSGVTHAPVEYIGDSSVTPYSSYIHIAPGSNYLGVYVDTTETKSFVVRTDANEGYRGRFSVTCFDSNDKVLGGAAPYYAQCQLDGSELFSYATSYGGQYHIGTDAASVLPKYVSFANDVKKAYFMFSPGTAGLKLRQIDIFSSDTTGYSGSAYSGIVEPVPGARIGTTSPTKWANLFKHGDITYNATPSAGDPQGWMCVFRLDTTLNGAVSSGATEITVIDDSGVTISDKIGILLDNTTTQWTTVSHSGGTNYFVLGNALTGDSVSGNTVYLMRWKAMANLES